MSPRLYKVFFLFVVITLNGCSDHDDDPIVFTELQVTASQNPVPINFQSQLTATAFYSDGHSNSIDSTWESLDETIATVDNRGMVTAVSPGQVAIQASITEGSGTLVLTVSDAAITSIQLDPLFAEIPVGHNIQYNAQGYFSDGSNHSINDHPDLVWVSTDESVAVIEKDTARSDTLSEGVTEITAVLNANTELAQTEVSSNTTQLTVTPHVLQTFSISPDRVTWPLGLTQQFTAEGIFSDGDTLNISGDVVWSSEPDGVLELIDDEGSKDNSGVFKGIAVGSSNVSASYKGLVSENKAAFVVEQMEMTNFTVDSATGEDTQPLGKEVQFKALAEFTDGNSYDVSGYKQVHWQSSDTSIATVTLSGAVKGIKEGTVTIKATTAIDGVVAEKEITITSAELETIVVQPINENSIISVGNSQQFEAYGLYTDGRYAEFIELDPDFTVDVSTALQDSIPGSNNNPPEITFQNSDSIIDVTYEHVGGGPGKAGITITIRDLYAQTYLALTEPESVLVTSPSFSGEFIGPLTSFEASELEVEFSDVILDPNRVAFITMTNEQAQLYCKGLLYNGHNDWRLPSSDELMTLERAEDDPSADVFANGWRFETDYWSITASESGHNKVSLDSFAINTANDDDAYYVSCVRSAL